MTSSSDNDTFEAWKCPDCDNLQENNTDCEACTYGADEEGWTQTRVSENVDGQLVEV